MWRNLNRDILLIISTNSQKHVWWNVWLNINFSCDWCVGNTCLRYDYPVWICQVLVVTLINIFTFLITWKTGALLGLLCRLKCQGGSGSGSSLLCPHTFTDIRYYLFFFPYVQLAADTCSGCLHKNSLLNTLSRFQKNLSFRYKHMIVCMTSRNYAGKKHLLRNGLIDYLPAWNELTLRMAKWGLWLF